MVETANGSVNQSWFIGRYNPTWITVVILELIHATQAPTSREGRAQLLDQDQSGVLVCKAMVTLDNTVDDRTAVEPATLLSNV